MLDSPYRYHIPGLGIREVQDDTLVALTTLDTGGLHVQGELLPGNVGANSVWNELRQATHRNIYDLDIECATMVVVVDFTSIERITGTEVDLAYSGALSCVRRGTGEIDLEY